MSRFVVLALFLTAAFVPAIGAAQTPPAIAIADMSTAAVVGVFSQGPLDTPTVVTSVREAEATFGAPTVEDATWAAVRLFFENGGARAILVRVATTTATPSAAALLGDRTQRTGLFALDRGPRFGLLVLPTWRDLDEGSGATALSTIAAYAASKRAFVVLDTPSALTTPSAVVAWRRRHPEHAFVNAAAYYPALVRSGRNVGCAGAIAGIYARLERAHGVWEPPSGSAATIQGGAPALTLSSTDSSALYEVGVNALRTFVGRHVVWGGRTLASSASAEDRWVSVRRLHDMIAQSLADGTTWAATRYDSSTLRAQLRAQAEAFLAALYADGALVGDRPQDAYFARCDDTTTTAQDAASGVLRLMVGFAPVRSGEFVIQTTPVRVLRRYYWPMFYISF